LGFFRSFEWSSCKFILSKYDTNAEGPSSVEQDFATTLSATTFYVEIIRTSAIQATVAIGPNSDFSSPTETETLTVDANTQGLRYFTVNLRIPTAVSNSTLTGTVSEILVLDGITSF